MTKSEPQVWHFESPPVTKTHVPGFEKQQSIIEKQVVRFRSLKKPNKDAFRLELSMKHSYDDVVEIVARQINLDDPSKIRLTSHNCWTQRPKTEPIKYRGVEHLFNMLFHSRRKSDILYYERLKIPLPELQDLRNLKVAFLHATKNEVVLHNIRLPKQNTVRDVINKLKRKVELSHPNAEVRLVKVLCHMLHKILPSDEKVEKIFNPYFNSLRAEEIPDEEKNPGPHDRLIPACHFTIQQFQDHQRVNEFGEPFFLVIHEGETLAEIKPRVQKKLQVSDEDFAKWKFASMSLTHCPKYLHDTDVVLARFPRRDVFHPWDCLGLEHSDNAPKVEVATTSNLEKRPSSTSENDASRKKHKPGELENQSSRGVESNARTQDNETKDTALESNIAQIDASGGSLAAEQQTINEISFDEMAMALLEKLEEVKVSNSVRMSDFNNVTSDRYVDVGVFTVPESLQSYAKHLYLLANRPHIGTGNYPVHYVNEMAFVVLCCALRSMDTTPSNEITESLILKWRDAIRGALQFGFKVEFLKDHLKSATQAYLAKSARNSLETKELEAIDDNIAAARKHLDTLTALRAEKCEKMNTELRKTCEKAAAKFSGGTYGFF